ncbi:Kef-type K+ transport system, membrane component KefB [Peptostreptococcaceae bacterium pGA-8]|nr:Kef-type K+ transport system, membrane component KefB [Peptostreptococcaceae bacterium pGA-8]
MLDHSYLLSIAIILLSTKFLSGVTAKINLPQVVGALLAGILIGPILGLVDDTTFLDRIAELGVIILMFMAGLDTDIVQMKKQGVSYLLIAAFGVLIPLIGGTLTYYFYYDVNLGNSTELLKAIFIGVILTATSVSITVEALREMGKLSSNVGHAIVGAAIVDDIIGIIILTAITAMKDQSIHIGVVIGKILIYFLAMFILSSIIIRTAKYMDARSERRRISIYAFALVLIVSYISEAYVGIADITGAYLTGMILSQFSIKKDIARKMNVPGYLFFSPIFFASIGLQTEISSIDIPILIFSAILLIVAISTKIIGAGIGALLCRYNIHDAFNVGIGMVSRGEVALIVAKKGYTLGLIDNSMFSPIVIIVLVTTVLAPIILKKSLK